MQTAVVTTRVVTRPSSSNNEFEQQMEETLNG